MGFGFDRQARGSHEIWRHVDGRKTTLVRHPRPIAEGTLRAILREAGIDVDEFLKVLNLTIAGQRFRMLGV
jgi:predicted RNA binding protein YcfA (HicA-like mRNA interferase family)